MAKVAAREGGGGFLERTGHGLLLATGIYILVVKVAGEPSCKAVLHAWFQARERM